MIDEIANSDSIAEVVQAGLRAHPKALPPWLFYDQTGSALFERITALPEYYLTRMERQLLHRHAATVMQIARDHRSLSIVELGAGSAQKTSLLLRAAQATERRITYLPVEISSSSLQTALLHLSNEFSTLRVQPVLADFVRDSFRIPTAPHDQRMLLWLGSSAGNFDSDDAIGILQNASEEMSAGDFLLLGLDLAPDCTPGGKQIEDILRAYEDADGVTAAFNQNVLTRINRELDADFSVERFQHAARWNSATCCVEMHLVSTVEQNVSIRALHATASFGIGESIHTENSRKYTPAEGRMLLREAGFTAVRTWLNADGWYGLFLGQREEG